MLPNARVGLKSRISFVLKVTFSDCLHFKSCNSFSSTWQPSNLLEMIFDANTSEPGHFLFFPTLRKNLTLKKSYSSLPKDLSIGPFTNSNEMVIFFIVFINLKIYDKLYRAIKALPFKWFMRFGWFTILTTRKLETFKLKAAVSNHFRFWPVMCTGNHQQRTFTKGPLVKGQQGKQAFECQCTIVRI